MINDGSSITGYNPNVSFRCAIDNVSNGFIVSVNGLTFVVQGTGNSEEDFWSLIQVLKQAYKVAGFEMPTRAIDEQEE